MFCPNCGGQLPENARFCSECGEKLESQQSAPQQSVPQQGMPQQGMPQQGMPQSVFQQSVPQQAGWQQGGQAGMPFSTMGGMPKKGKKLKIVIGVIVALVVIIGGLVGYSAFCKHRTYESKNGKFSANVGGAQFTINGKLYSGSFYCSPRGVIKMTGGGFPSERVSFQLDVPKSWMKTGKTINLGSLGDGAVLKLWVGNDSASTEDFYWVPEDMKISLESISSAGIRMPGADSAFLPFGVCKISFRIQYYYDGELCNLEGFGVAMY